MAMTNSRTLAVAAMLGAALSLGACGDNEKLGQATTYEKGKYKGKPDTRPYENAPSAYSNGSNWNAGDRTGWENAVKNRQQRQNEYNRAE
jgi:hypothetical protein